MAQAAIVESSTRSSEWFRQSLLSFSPAELAEQNPQLAICSPISYVDMRDNFDPQSFMPIEVVRIETTDEAGNKSSIYGVIDGHTRLKFATDTNRKDITQFNQILAFDRTQRELAKLGKVNRDSLTMEEYLYSVVEATKAHQDIAPDRIAAHFLNSWSVLVGTKAASCCSASAALSILADRDTPKGTPAQLEQFVRRLFNSSTKDLTQEQRERVIPAFMHIDQVLNDLQVTPESVYRGAFKVLATQEGLPGGKEQAILEIIGLVSDSRVFAGADSGPVQEQPISVATQQWQLAEAALAILSREFQHRNNIDEPMQFISSVLFDQSLTISEKMGLFDRPDPRSIYAQLRRLNRLTRLGADLELNGNEIHVVPILETFSQLNFSAKELGSAARLIAQAQQVLALEDRLFAQIREINFIDQEQVLRTAINLLVDAAAAGNQIRSAESPSVLKKEIAAATMVLNELQKEYERLVESNTHIAPSGQEHLSVVDSDAPYKTEPSPQSQFRPDRVIIPTERPTSPTRIRLPERPRDKSKLPIPRHDPQTPVLKPAETYSEKSNRNLEKLLGYVLEEMRIIQISPSQVSLENRSLIMQLRDKCIAWLLVDGYDSRD